MQTLDLTILYKEGDNGWVVVSIPAVPGVLSQGPFGKRRRRPPSVRWRKPTAAGFARRGLDLFGSREMIIARWLGAA
jgi:hypothetical protein